MGGPVRRAGCLEQTEQESVARGTVWDPVARGETVFHSEAERDDVTRT